MNSFLKKIFGTLTQKPWEAERVAIDTKHSGQTFNNLSNQMSAVIIIFGISSVLFSLIFTGYLYSLARQDTTLILKTNLLWINTFGSYFCYILF